MTEQTPLTTEQEETRQEGLRILARIIARHYLSHPELYEGAVGEHVDGDRECNRQESVPDINRLNGKGNGS